MTKKIEIKTKYNVGDKVTIRRDLKKGITYPMENGMFGNTANTEMIVYSNKQATIANIVYNRYKIIEDLGYWYWTDEMFENDRNLI